METICHSYPEEKVKIRSITINNGISPLLSVDLVNMEKPKITYTANINCVTDDQIKRLVTNLLEKKDVTIRRTVEITF